MVKVSTQRLEDCQALLQVEVEPELLERSLERAYRRLVQRINVPGFRRGKAPRAILERHVGRHALLEEAVDALLPEAYQQALEGEELEAVAQPQIEIENLEPLTFKATVPLRPVVELGDYRSIRLERKPVEVTEGEVSSVVEQIRSARATWEPVERPVAFQDLLTIDVLGRSGEETVVDGTEVEHYVVKGSLMPAPGFSEALIGVKSGQEIDGIELTVGDEHPVAEERGKQYHFKVKVHEVKERRLPDLDDEFAKAVDGDYQTMAELRAAIGADLLARKEAQAIAELREQAVAELEAQARIEYPPVLLERELERLMEERGRQRRSQEAGALDQYIADMRKGEDELKDEQRPEAERRLKRWLILDKLTQDEAIVATPEEIDAEVEKLVAGTTEGADALRQLLSNEASRESLAEAIQGRKTFDRLVEIVTGALDEPAKAALEEIEETEEAETPSLSEEAAPPEMAQAKED